MRSPLRMMPTLVAVACTLPPIEMQAAECDAATVTRVATGETFDSLAEAISVAHTDDHFCLGPGDYDLDSVAIQRLSDSVYDETLRIEGAGSSETVLHATQGFDTLLYIEMDGELTLEGLTISGGRARLKATDLFVSDLAFRDYEGWERGLTLKGDHIEVDGLQITGNQMDYASGLYVSAEVQGDLGDLYVFGNESAAGYLVELHGPIALHDSQIISNTLTLDQPGYDLLELFGPSTVDNVQFLHNDFNGPALRAYDTLDADGLVISDNTTHYAAVLTLMGETLLTDSQILGNIGHDGAIGLYDGASVDIEAVNDGVTDSSNDPCDIYGDPCVDTEDGACVPQCLETALVGGEPLHCDATGCDTKSVE